MIVISLPVLLILAAAATLTGFGAGVLAMWRPERENPSRDSVPPPPRTPGPRRAGYLHPGPNAGCYEPRGPWPEPDWPAPGDTFSEISAGWDRLERTVIARTQPFGRIIP